MSDFLWPIDCSPPGSSVHGILQAIILEWVVTLSSRGPPWPEIELKSPESPALAGKFFTTTDTWEAPRWEIFKGQSEFSSVVHLLSRVQAFAIPWLQHTRPPCPSPTPGVYSNSCPLSQWCHPIISSSVVPFAPHLQSFPASGFFQMSQFSTESVSNTKKAAGGPWPFCICSTHIQAHNGDFTDQTAWSFIQISNTFKYYNLILQFLSIPARVINIASP